MADYVFCPHKKITSRTIRNSSALIVIPNVSISAHDLELWGQFNLVGGLEF
jgi:hypothetical protein